MTYKEILSYKGVVLQVFRDPEIPKDTFVSYCAKLMYNDDYCLFVDWGVDPEEATERLLTRLMVYIKTSGRSFSQILASYNK